MKDTEKTPPEDNEAVFWNFLKYSRTLQCNWACLQLYSLGQTPVSIQEASVFFFIKSNCIFTCTVSFDVLSSIHTNDPHLHRDRHDFFIWGGRLLHPIILMHTNLVSKIVQLRKNLNDWIKDLPHFFTHF